MYVQAEEATGTREDKGTFQPSQNSMMREISTVSGMSHMCSPR